MGSKVEKHLSRLAMPKTWQIQKKGIKYITRPNPGAHSFKYGMALSVVMKDLTNHAKTTKEVKRILHKEEVLVDGVKRKDHKLIVGLLDVIAFPKTKESFRIVFSKKGHLTAIKAEDAKLKPCKINGKTILKKGTIQLNLDDGKNILVKEDKYKVGDSVLLELPELKIKDSFKFEKGSTVYLTGGKHVGDVGIIEDIKGTQIIYKKGKDLFETAKSYAFVIGKDKPSIKLE